MESTPPDQEAAVNKDEDETPLDQTTTAAKAGAESLPSAANETDDQASEKRPWWKFWG